MFMLILFAFIFSIAFFRCLLPSISTIFFREYTTWFGPLRNVKQKCFIFKHWRHYFELIYLHDISWPHHFWQIFTYYCTFSRTKIFKKFVPRNNFFEKIFPMSLEDCYDVHNITFSQNTYQGRGVPQRLRLLPLHAVSPTASELKLLDRQLPLQNISKEIFYYSK